MASAGTNSITLNLLRHLAAKIFCHNFIVCPVSKLLAMVDPYPLPRKLRRQYIAGNIK